MALKLTGRNPAKFEFDDGVSQTTVVIQPDDEPDVVRAKLQRVLELEGVSAQPSAEALEKARRQLILAQMPEVPEFTAADRAATDKRLAQAQSMGWAEGTDFDQLPEA